MQTSCAASPGSFSLGRPHRWCLSRPQLYHRLAVLELSAPLAHGHEQDRDVPERGWIAVLAGASAHHPAAWRKPGGGSHADSR